MSLSIAIFSGSLRKESFTTKLVHAVQELAPKDCATEFVPIGNLPLFNQDMELTPPADVTVLHEIIRKVDGVIFVTPEYNRSYTAPLKNAIDWGSRPHGNNVWDNKPVAILGCTPSTLGAFGAVQHLRQVLMYLNMHPLQQPEFYLADASTKFTAEGKLQDETTQQKIIDLWSAFIPWIRKIQTKTD